MVQFPEKKRYVTLEWPLTKDYRKSSPVVPPRACQSVWRRAVTDTQVAPPSPSSWRTSFRTPSTASRDDPVSAIASLPCLG